MEIDFKKYRIRVVCFSCVYMQKETAYNSSLFNNCYYYQVTIALFIFGDYNKIVVHSDCFLTIFLFIVNAVS